MSVRGQFRPSSAGARCPCCPDEQTSLAWAARSESAINCRDCDVPSLAGPEPDRQAFRQAQAPVAQVRRALGRITSGEILRAFAPTECANYFRNSS